MSTIDYGIELNKLNQKGHEALVVKSDVRSRIATWFKVGFCICFLSVYQKYLRTFFF